MWQKLMTSSAVALAWTAASLGAPPTSRPARVDISSPGVAVQILADRPEDAPPTPARRSPAAL